MLRLTCPEVAKYLQRQKSWVYNQLSKIRQRKKHAGFINGEELYELLCRTWAVKSYEAYDYRKLWDGKLDFTKTIIKTEHELCRLIVARKTMEPAYRVFNLVAYYYRQYREKVHLKNTEFFKNWLLLTTYKAYINEDWEKIALDRQALYWDIRKEAETYIRERLKKRFFH